MNEGKEWSGNTSSSDEAMKPTTIMQCFYNVFSSAAMLAGLQLDLFTPLEDGPMTGDSLAGVLGVRADKLEPLLYSLAAANLLQAENGKFALTEETARYLVQGRPEYIGDLGGFYNSLWSISLKTAESIKTGEPRAKFDFHTLSDEDLLVYFQRQIHSSLGAGREIAEIINFAGYEHLLDAGGGSGGVSIALCTKYPRLKATVADLPRVAKLAERFVAEAGLSDRVKAITGDLCSAPPDGKYDVALARALIQTQSPEDARKTLVNIGRALRPGGDIYIFGSVLRNSRQGPPASLAYGLVFLNTYDDGKAYTEDEYQEMLTEAGFIDITVGHEVTIDGTSLVRARKG